MDFTGFKWLSESSVEVNGNEVLIYAPGHTDYFNNPIPEDGKLMEPQGNAPFYYKDVTGDFVFKAKVIPEHKTTYDAVMVGLEAQCPTGEGAYRRYQDVSLEMITVEDLRAGK